MDPEDHIYAHKLEIDWGGSGTFGNPWSDLSPLVTRSSVRRDLAGILPEELTLIEGYVAGQAVIDLGGIDPVDASTPTMGGWEAAQLLSPLRTDSPLAATKRKGVLARYTIVEDGLTHRQFTGKVRSISVSSRERTAQIVCSDWVEDMRGVVDLPVVGTAQGAVFNPTWVLDWLLRQAQLHASPPTRADAIVSATLAGAWWPEKGWFDDETNGIPSSLAPPWVPGKYSFAANASASAQALQEYHTDVAFCPRANTAIAIGYWINWTSSIGDTQVSHSFALGVDATNIVNMFIGATGALQSALVGPSYSQTSTGPTITTPGWHYVGVHYKFTTTATTVTFRLDGVSATPQSKPAYPLTITIPLRTQVRIDLRAQANCVQVWTPPYNDTPTFPVDPATVATSLELALNQLRTLPDRHGVPAIDVYKEITSADLGAIGADENGVVHFWRRSTITEVGPLVIEDIDAGSLTDLDAADSLDQTANVITGQVAPTTVFRGDTWGPNNIVFDEKDSALLRTGPNTTRVANVPFDADGAAWVREGSIPFVATASWVKEGVNATQHGFVVADATTHAHVNGVTVSVKRVNPRALEVSVVNTSASTIDLRLADSTFTPAFRVQGSRIHVYDRPNVQFDAAFDFSVQDAASIARNGQRLYTLPDNDWRQNLTDSQSLANELLADTKEPAAVIQRVTVVGKPDRKVGHTVAIVDPDGIANRVVGVILGVDRTLSGTEGLQDTVTIQLSS